MAVSTPWPEFLVLSAAACEVMVASFTVDPSSSDLSKTVAAAWSTGTGHSGCGVLISKWLPV